MQKYFLIVILLITPLPSAAANITMECEFNVYRYVNNWFKKDEVLVRSGGEWVEWCDTSVRKKAESSEYEERIFKNEFEIGDNSGRCKVTEKSLKKKFKKQSRRSTPVEWKQRVTDLNLCLNEDASLISGAYSTDRPLSDLLSKNKNEIVSIWANVVEVFNNGFETPSGYLCWEGLLGSKEVKLEWTKEQLEKKGYEIRLKPIRDGVETLEYTTTTILDFYLKKRDGEQCKVLKN